MTPKEKAKELVNKYDFDHNEFDYSKEYALIAVNEILEMDLPILEEEADKFYEYWQEVKHEIEKFVTFFI